MILLCLEGLLNFGLLLGFLASLLHWRLRLLRFERLRFSSSKLDSAELKGASILDERGFLLAYYFFVDVCFIILTKLRFPFISLKVNAA